MGEKREITLEDVKKDFEFRYFYDLLSKDYKARLDPEYAVLRYFIDNFNTTDLRKIGKDGIPMYEFTLRKMYRVKSVFHCLQPTEEDRKRLEKRQEVYKEINRDTVVKIPTQTTLL